MREISLIDLDTPAPQTAEEAAGGELPVGVDVAGQRKTVSIFSAFSVDEDLAENGRWFEDVFSAVIPNVDVKLRRFSSKHTTATKQRIDKAMAHRAGKDGKYPDDVAETVLINLIAQSILVDWRGIYDENGVELPCTPQNRLRVLSNVPEFRVILALSNIIDNYRAKQVEQIEGN